ncbi:MAG: hypothetical protein N3A54_00790 [Patescibacteria group bacterium]|nr:hypothetical protein [Patescibacteria group bacterium]
MYELPLKEQAFLLEYEKEDIAKIFRDKIDKILSEKKFVFRSFDDLYEKFEETIQKEKEKVYLTDFPIGGHLVINFFSKIKKMLEQGPIDTERLGIGTQEDQLLDFMHIMPKVLLIYAFYKKFPKYMKVFEKETGFNHPDKVKNVLMSFDTLSFYELYQFVSSSPTQLKLFFDTANKGILEYTVKKHLKPIYEKENIQIYEVKRYKECRVLGSDTNWCTSSSSGEFHVEKYLNRGRLFIVFEGDEKYQVFFDNLLLNSNANTKEKVFRLVLSFVLNALDKKDQIKNSKKYNHLFNTLQNLSNNMEGLIESDFKALSDSMNDVFSKKSLIPALEWNPERLRSIFKAVFIPEDRRQRNDAKLYNSILALKTMLVFNVSISSNMISALVILPLLYSFFEEEMVNFQMWNTVKEETEKAIAYDVVGISSTDFIFEIKDRRDIPVSVAKTASLFDLMKNVIPESASTLSSFSQILMDHYDKNERYVFALEKMFILDIGMIEKVIYPIFLKEEVLQKFRVFADAKNINLKRILKMIMSKRFYSLNEYYEMMKSHVGDRMESLLDQTAEQINSINHHLRVLLSKELEMVQSEIVHIYKEPLEFLDRLIKKIDLEKEER